MSGPSRAAICCLAAVAFLAAPPAARGQEAPAPAAAAPAAAPAPPSDTGGVIPYQRGTYRDPFRSLDEPKPEANRPRPAGPPGMLIEEIDVVGILSGPKGAMVLIMGTDGLGYSLTEGSELYDGKVLHIDPKGGIVVFRQNVNDPNLIKPYRDIERRLDTAS
jgi:hypothetical protein